MVVYYKFYVLHAAVTYFDFASIEYVIINAVINVKTLMMSLVGLKASKTNKIVKLFYLILNIFILQLLRNNYKNTNYRR